eukprot:4356756-Pleurochrysis_carterae.AAC.1
MQAAQDCLRVANVRAEGVAPPKAVRHLRTRCHSKHSRKQPECTRAAHARRTRSECRIDDAA